jgi:hypothetical protein
MTIEIHELNKYFDEIVEIKGPHLKINARWNASSVD